MNRYLFRLVGHPGPELKEWFSPFQTLLLENGELLFVGPVPDQAALYGWLNTFRNLGFDLLDVHCIEKEKKS